MCVTLQTCLPWFCETLCFVSNSNLPDPGFCATVPVDVAAAGAVGPVAADSVRAAALVLKEG